MQVENRQKNKKKRLVTRTAIHAVVEQTPDDDVRQNISPMKIKTSCENYKTTSTKLISSESAGGVRRIENLVWNKKHLKQNNRSFKDVTITFI